MTARIGRPPVPTLDRWLANVSVGHESGCWVWEGGRTRRNYGVISHQGKTKLVHIWAYEQFRGPVPDGLTLDHDPCDNPPCCNPQHLIPRTMGDNIRRNRHPSQVAHRNGTCQRGLHDMTDVYVTVGGRRQCQPCQLDRAAERRDEK